MTTSATHLIESLTRAEKALAGAASQLETARLELKRLRPYGPESETPLLAQEIADVLARVKAERETIAGRAEGDWH